MTTNESQPFLDELKEELHKRNLLENSNSSSSEDTKMYYIVELNHSTVEKNARNSYAYASYQTPIRILFKGSYDDCLIGFNRSVSTFATNNNKMKLSSELINTNTLEIYSHCSAWYSRGGRTLVATLMIIAM